MDGPPVLDASPSDWPGDGRRSDFLRISGSVPGAAAAAHYEAQLDIGRPSMSPAGYVRGTPRWSTGVSFVSDPVPEDMVLAGYIKAAEKVEGPDPAYWCAQGCAICNPDPCGIAESGGDSAMFGRQEGEDCYDLIEWLGGQHHVLRQGRDKRDLLPHGRAVDYCHRAAAAPGRDQPGRGIQRRLP